MSPFDSLTDSDIRTAILNATVGQDKENKGKDEEIEGARECPGGELNLGGRCSYELCISRSLRQGSECNESL